MRRAVRRLRVGERFLDAYEVLAPLGGYGGQVDLWQARAADGREVVVEITTVDLGDPSGAWLRPLEDSPNLLDHPGVVRVFDWGRDPGTDALFVVTERLVGRTLGGLGPLPAGEPWALAADLAEALGVAHERRLVHGRVTPEHVVVEPSGRARLLPPAGLADWPGFTTTGLPRGGPYLAPEVVRGRPRTARTDVYGLAATLYQALCGRPPLSGRTTLDLTRAICEQAPEPPSLLRPGLRMVVSVALERALAKAPEDRFPDVASFLTVLRQGLA
ncbi:MAG: hypothetical protein KF878_23490 [Planctomycetes bacterium]|nr:hypothetical protein [Planctomycetota bacterium]